MRYDRTSYIALLGAALMMAHQVSGKAVRDSYFLSNYAASDLPKVVIAAAAIAIVFVLFFARSINRFGPNLIVPAGFLASAFLHGVEYVYVQDNPLRWSVIIYFHIAALGAILLSGFWSLMTESFDPRTAKRVFGRITAAGTVGGVAGGIVAERMAALASIHAVLVMLAVLHVCCSFLLAGIHHAPHRLRPHQPEKTIRPVALFRRAPYLGMIALVVLAGTSSSAILDYLFKAGAGRELGKGEDLLRFFAAFYTVTQILTLLAQTFLSRVALQLLGIGRTISALPFGVGAGALGFLLIPVFPMITLVRAVEFVLRGSLYRSAYELLYTPVPPAEKRSAKTLIDVGFDRAGEALGSGIVQLLLWGGSSFITPQLLGLALALAAGGVWISLRLDSAYTKLIQQRLVDRAIELDVADAGDSTTRSAFMTLPAGSAARKPPLSNVSALSGDADPTVAAIRELRSGDSRRVIAALKDTGKISPVIAAQLLRLLAWDEVAEAVRAVLLRDPNPITGLLIDHLSNREQIQFGIRRRIPRILSHCDSPLAVHGLLAGLADDRFEVRFQCSRALDSLALRRPDLKIPAEAVFSAVEKELRVARPIWNSRRIVDSRKDDPDGFLDDVLRDRADQSLEHVFSLLATVLPREPVKIAFRVLHTEDKTLRGLAAEYLDSILPANIRKLLWSMVEPGETKQEAAAESGQIALDKLLNSHQSLLLMIDRKEFPSK